jgi:hypothetical protein
MMKEENPLDHQQILLQVMQTISNQLIINSPVILVISIISITAFEVIECQDLMRLFSH